MAPQWRLSGNCHVPVFKELCRKGNRMLTPSHDFQTAPMVCTLETDSVSNSHDVSVNVFMGVGRCPQHTLKQRERIRIELGAMFVDH